MLLAHPLLLTCPVLLMCPVLLTFSVSLNRKIIDGPGSRTVFTGNRKGQEMPFTIENYHAAG